MPTDVERPGASVTKFAGAAETNFVTRGAPTRIAPETGFWVTEVLAEPLRAKVTKEGRKLLALGTCLPMARPGLRQLFAPAEPARRRPERLVPIARGRIPWPAPWVAGALVRELLNRRNVKLTPGPLKLTQALFGRRQVEPAEFKAQTRGLTAPVLKWWVESFKQRSEQRFGPTGTSPELWGAAFYSDLAVQPLGSVFPSDPEGTRELLLVYAAVRRRGGQNPHLSR
jgi:hypothetical protein